MKIKKEELDKLTKNHVQLALELLMALAQAGCITKEAYISTNENITSAEEIRKQLGLEEAVPLKLREKVLSMSLSVVEELIAAAKKYDPTFEVPKGAGNA